jgi:hypothetical protein
LRQIAVVVPSPAKSLVLELTSLPFEHPFQWIFQSISFATNTIFSNVCPPKAFPIITLRPLVKSYFTAFANASTPRFNPSRASISNFISFAIFSLGRRSFRQYVYQPAVIFFFMCLSLNAFKL